MSFSKGKRKFLIITSIILGVSLFSHPLFAYDETIIHPSLTIEAAKLYNLNFEEKLTNQEIDWIRQGSIDEDDVDYLTMRARSSNHFYDPINKTGWTNTKTLEILGEPSPVWAYDSVKQSLFPRGDYTWKRATYDYVNGDKKHAYEALGHILHLIEDKTVPAHTRNDFHLSPTIAGRDMGEREPFEDWTRNNARAGNIKFAFAEKLFQENKKPIIFDNLDQYFENVALYTNTGFFSKDTIEKYREPKAKIFKSELDVDGKPVMYGYGYDEYNIEYRLANVKNIKADLIDKDDNGIYSIAESSEKAIYSDYWFRLAPKSILAGAGIIKLFKDEVKKAEKNPVAIQKPDTFTTYYFTKPAAKTAVAVNSAIATAANNIVSGLSQMKDKMSYSLAPSASSNHTLVFDMSQAIPSSSITLLGGVVQIQSAKAADPAHSQVSQEPIYSAALVLQSEPEVITEPNKEINLRAQFKNTGTASWQQDKIYLNIYLKNDAANQFYHSSWLTSSRPTKITEPQVVPESFGNFSFLINSPQIAGDYFFKVRPVWQDNAKNFNWIGGDIISWHIKVVSADIIQPGGETLNKDTGNIIDISQSKEQDESTNAKNDNEKEGQAPDQNKDNIEKDGEANKTNENEKSQDSADNTGKNNTDGAETTAPVAPTPFAPIFRLSRDITPPETDIIEKPTVKTSANTASFKFSSSKDNSTFLCSFDRGNFINCEASEVYKNLPDGNHILKVKAIDRFDNIDETPAEFAWTIDSTPPAKITNLAAVAGGTRGKIKLSWTKPEENVFYEIRFAEKPIVETGASAEQANWQDAIQISEAIDNNAEQIETDDLTHFVPGKTYYFAIKSKDGLSNISEISNSASSVANAQANHIVISEIQVAGATATDEFVELYNPTNSAVNLSGWRLTRKTASGDTTENLLTSFPDKAIPAFGYFLIAHSNYDGSVAADATYSTQSSLASNNTIILYSDAGVTVVDLIGTGSAVNHEGAAITNPSDNGSIERKAKYSSTTESMSVGADKYLGNSWDSDNNSADFILRLASDPQNSLNPIEPRFPVFLQNLTMTYFAFSVNNGSDGYLSQVSQTIGTGLSQRLVKATARVKCVYNPECDVRYKIFNFNAFYDKGYTNPVRIQKENLSSQSNSVSTPFSIPAGDDMDVNFSGWTPLIFDTFNPDYYYKITFGFNTIDYRRIQWGGSSTDSYPNGNSIIEDYPGGADLYFKLWSE